MHFLYPIARFPLRRLCTFFVASKLVNLIFTS
ncbi:hypothetical protein D046_1070A, partial [Vibrio parahaemolyticus V-223/04]